jgi:hypothetical protein
MHLGAVLAAPSISRVPCEIERMISDARRVVTC